MTNQPITFRDALTAQNYCPTEEQLEQDLAAAQNWLDTHPKAKAQGYTAEDVLFTIAVQAETVRLEREQVAHHIEQNVLRNAAGYGKEIGGMLSTTNLWTDRQTRSHPPEG